MDGGFACVLSTPVFLPGCAGNYGKALADCNAAIECNGANVKAMCAALSRCLFSFFPFFSSFVKLSYLWSQSACWSIRLVEAVVSALSLPAYVFVYLRTTPIADARAFIH
jgi:hypothetical protein